MASRRTRSTSVRGRRAAALVAGLLVLATAACGSGSSGSTGAGQATSEGPGSDGRPWTSRTWFDVEATDDPHVVELVYWAPDTEAEPRCEEERETYTADAGRDLDVTIVAHVAEGSMPPDECPWSVQRIALDLTAPLGDRRLTVASGDVAFVEAGDGYAVVPETTPCGRADCSTPSPDPAPCDGEHVRAAFAAEVDGGILPEGEPRCDGTFLITDMDVGSSGCAPTDGAESPCKNVKRAYFVARGGDWRIVTYGTGETCESVLHVSAIAFPAELCG